MIAFNFISIFTIFAASFVVVAAATKEAVKIVFFRLHPSRTCLESVRIHGKNFERRANGERCAKIFSATPLCLIYVEFLWRGNV